MVDNLLVIGTGLIGGSFAKGLKDRKTVSTVVGFGRNQANLQKGVEAGVIDVAANDLDAAIKNADVIFLSVPTLAVQSYIRLIAEHKKPSAVVTDAASVKGEIIEGICAELGKVPEWFVAGHPIAGSEKSGILASNGDLYVDHKVILTPLENTTVEAQKRISDLWEALGAEVVSMPLALHDEVLAATSHLPHLLAFALVDCLQGLASHDDIFRFAAGGFRDFTRIAASDPVMWHDIMKGNKKAIMSQLHAFKDTLSMLEQAIEADDSECILESFERASQARKRFGEKNL